MNYLKKTLAIFLMVCMLAGMMPTGTAFAAADVPEGSVTVEETATGSSAPEEKSATTTETKDAGTTPSEPSTPSTPSEGTDPAAGAGAGGAGDACTHDQSTWVAIPGKAATCTEKGLTEGKRCPTCNKTTVEQTEIPALGHTWVNGVCSVCSTPCEHKKDENGEKVSAWNHTDSAKSVCDVCKLECTHASTVEDPKAEPNCTTAGHEAGTKCTVCGKYTTGGAAIAALGHKWDYTDPNLAKCTNSGCGLSCSHKKTEGDKTTKLFENGTCTNCNYTCPHKTTENGAEKSALDAAGICTLCGSACKHEKLTGNKCDFCGKSFEAMVTSAVAAAADDAQIGTKIYPTLAEAVADMTESGTITLLQNVTSSKLIYFHKPLEVTLDLGGHTLEVTVSNCAVYVDAGSLTIRNGTIKYDRENVGAVNVGSGAALTLESDATVESRGPGTDGNYYGIDVVGSGTRATIKGKVYGYFSAVCVLGDGNGTATVDIYGNLEGHYYALAGNGANHGTEINIHEGANLSSGSTAIYHPQNGTMNISGGTITGGETGVEVRAGTVNITGGTITGNGNPFGAGGNVSGTTTVGAGLAVVQHTTKLPINVTVSGGTISGVRAIYEEDIQGNGVAENGSVSISVKGGELKGEVYSGDDNITFSEGAALELIAEVTAKPDAADPKLATVDHAYVHAGATNRIKANGATSVQLPKKALAECAPSDNAINTVVTIETADADVSLDAAALRTINTAVTAADGSATVHVEKVAETKDGKKFQVYITDQDGNPIASNGATLDGGKATVVLKGIMTEPKQVKHYDLQADGITNKFMVHIVKPDFTYDADKDTVTVTIDHFSYLETSMEAVPVAPEITTTEADLPTAYIGKEYPETKLDATGTKPITWSKDETTNAWPSWLTLESTGTIKANGPVPEGTTDTTITVKAENDAGSVTKDFTITVEEYVVARLYDENFNELAACSTVQEAVDAAEAFGDDAYYTVILEKDSPSEDVKINDANVILMGDVVGGEAFRLKSITFGSGCEGSAVLIEAGTVTVEQGAAAYLGEGNNITRVVNKNMVGNVDNPDASVLIDGGHYGSLIPSTRGSYLVTGGTFKNPIPMEYCRFDIDADGNIVLDENGEPKIVQRYAKYNSSLGAYEIVPFKFDITAVSNSGYHMPGSRKTLVFSTNLDYDLAVRDSDKATITLTYGKSSKDISSVCKITKDKNGKAQFTLDANTLNKLALGRYTLTYDGPTGRDSMYFHISNTVKTGDTSNIGLWMGIMGVSVVALCAVAALLVIKSKKKNGGAKGKDDK